MYPSSSNPSDSGMYEENVRRAHDLRNKAQQLAKDEMAIMNQAVDLNLLARQLAEATMRPNILNQASVPVYFSLPPGMNNQGAYKMQFMRAQAIGSQAQFVNLASSRGGSSSSQHAAAGAGGIEQPSEQVEPATEAAAAAAAQLAAAQSAGAVAAAELAAAASAVQQDQQPGALAGTAAVEDAAAAAAHQQHIAQEQAMAAVAGLQQQGTTAAEGAAPAGPAGYVKDEDGSGLANMDVDANV